MHSFCPQLVESVNHDFEHVVTLSDRMGVVPARRAELVEPVDAAQSVLGGIDGMQKARTQHAGQLEKLSKSLAGSIAQAEATVEASRLLSQARTYLGSLQAISTTPYDKAEEAVSDSTLSQDSELSALLHHCMCLERAGSALGTAWSHSSEPPPLVASLHQALAALEADTLSAVQRSTDRILHSNLGLDDAVQVGQLLRCHVAIRRLGVFEAAVIHKITLPALKSAMLSLPTPSTQDVAAIVAYFSSWCSVLQRIARDCLPAVCEYAACLPATWSPVLECLWQPWAQLMLQQGLREEWKRPARTGLFRAAHLGVQAAWNTLLQADVSLAGTLPKQAAAAASRKGSHGQQLFEVFSSGCSTWFGVVLNELVEAAVADSKHQSGNTSRTAQLSAQLAQDVNCLLVLPPAQFWCLSLQQQLPQQEGGAGGLAAVLASALHYLLGTAATVGGARPRIAQAIKQAFLSVVAAATPNTRSEGKGLQGGLGDLLQAHSAVSCVNSMAALVLPSAVEFAASCSPPRPPAVAAATWSAACSELQRSVSARCSALLQRAGTHTGKHCGGVFSGIRRPVSKAASGSGALSTYSASSPDLLRDATALVQGALSEHGTALHGDEGMGVFREALFGAFCSEAAGVCEAAMQATKGMQGGQLSWLHGGEGAGEGSPATTLSPQERVAHALEVECTAAVQLLLGAVGRADSSPHEVNGWGLVEAAMNRNE